MPPSRDGWLSESDWKTAQASLPITCVDVLPLRDVAGQTELGLILREVPPSGRAWCLVGGRLRRDEPLSGAVHRELQECLGDAITPVLPAPEQPSFVAQYMTSPRPGYGYDPRQHAVSLTFAVRISGWVEPRGEALEFRWLPISEVDSLSPLGFGQDAIVAACLRAEGLIP